MYFYNYAIYIFYIYRKFWENAQETISNGCFCDWDGVQDVWETFFSLYIFAQFECIYQVDVSF